jgi:hypothetical protein
MQKALALHQTALFFKVKNRFYRTTITLLQHGFEACWGKAAKKAPPAFPLPSICLTMEQAQCSIPSFFPFLCAFRERLAKDWAN